MNGPLELGLNPEGSLPRNRVVQDAVLGLEQMARVRGLPPVMETSSFTHLSS